MSLTWQLRLELKMNLADEYQRPPIAETSIPAALRRSGTLNVNAARYSK
jgi:hypothetical protein